MYSTGSTPQKALIHDEICNVVRVTYSIILYSFHLLYTCYFGRATTCKGLTNMLADEGIRLPSIAGVFDYLRYRWNYLA